VWQRDYCCVKTSEAGRTNLSKPHFNTVLRVKGIKPLAHIRPCLDGSQFKVWMPIYKPCGDSTCKTRGTYNCNPFTHAA
jgi:hypothetical protein